MSARVEADSQGTLGTTVTQPGAAVPPPPVVFDNDDQFGGPALPNDHPKWLRDAVSLSQRARALITTLKPVVLHVMSVWDHRARSIVIAGRKVVVDASGSYRMD